MRWKGMLNVTSAGGGGGGGAVVTVAAVVAAVVISGMVLPRSAEGARGGSLRGRGRASAMMMIGTPRGSGTTTMIGGMPRGARTTTMIGGMPPGARTTTMTGTIHGIGVANLPNRVANLPRNGIHRGASPPKSGTPFGSL